MPVLTISYFVFSPYNLSLSLCLHVQIQVAHNVEIGKHCLICAQSGIAGSTKIGDFCLIGGQVGIAQHLEIGDHVQIAAKSGVLSNVGAGERIGGVPAVPIQQFHRQTHFLAKQTRRGK